LYGQPYALAGVTAAQLGERMRTFEPSGAVLTGSQVRPAEELLTALRKVSQELINTSVSIVHSLKWHPTLQHIQFLKSLQALCANLNLLSK
jgi:hypothetical protein